MKKRHFAVVTLAFAGASGCATVKPKQDYERASAHIEAATGQSVAVDPEGDARTRQLASGMLADGLTAEEAMQLALLNNPRLQAGFLRIGIGRAAVVQSGLFSNPSLALSLRFPDGGGLADFEVSLAQNIAELWQIRPRVRAAERDLDQTILILAREASIAAFDAHSAYLRSLQADRQLEIARENLSIAAQLVELTEARRQAGSGTEVDVNLGRAERAALDVTTRTSLVTAVEAKTTLAKILGLTMTPGELHLIDALPDAIDLSFTPQELVEIARGNRLDLKAADAVTQAAEARVAYERARFLRTIDLGISMEREARQSQGDRNWLAETAYASAQAGTLTPPSLQPEDSQSTEYVTGPTLSMELPFFDQNQAQVARAEFELLQASYLRDAIDREIVQESWAVHTRAKTAFENAVFMRDELLPLRENGLRLAREAYRVGSTTILTVLDSQRRLLEARSGYVDVQAAAGVARIDLERIAGQPFAVLSALPVQAQPQTPGDNP